MRTNIDIDDKLMETAINLALKDLELRLASKQDSAVSMAAALAPTPAERAEAITRHSGQIDAVLTVSEHEKLQEMDFESMSAADIARAKREIAKLHLPLDARRTRRHRPIHWPMSTSTAFLWARKKARAACWPPSAARSAA